MYDFGQLTNTTEQDYTKQIVTNHCSRTHSQQIITAVSHVLAWCQKFMRDKEVSLIATGFRLFHVVISQDECSFVSLRDVERAMIVFKFFISKFELFKDLIAAKAKNDVRSKDCHNFQVYIVFFSSSFIDSSAGCPYMVPSAYYQYLLSCSTTEKKGF